jgi:hypothetical protein
MRREQYREFQEWFSQYVGLGRYDHPRLQSWAKLKIDHTHRVTANMAGIGQSLDLSEEDLLIAGTVGLFHDVGRFKQIELYGTFNDSRSENHATLGTKVLREAGVLEGLPEEERDTILKAVELHNLRDLPQGLPDRWLLFARLIRDADKLDILEVFTRYYTGDGTFATALDSYLPDTPGYSATLVGDILSLRRCNYSDVKNRNDRKLLNLSWVYDINFAYTLAEIVNNGFIDKIMGALPQSQEITAVHRHIMAYVERRLGITL